jgi:hypothetical protein
MEMNFPHRQYGQRSKAKGSDYALILAAAASRQMRGATAQLAISDQSVGGEVSNSIDARISYFGRQGKKARARIGGAFFPTERASVATSRIYENGVYFDALVNCKSTALVSGLSEMPTALRGMED